MQGVAGGGGVGGGVGTQDRTIECHCEKEMTFLSASFSWSLAPTSTLQLPFVLLEGK